MPHWWSFISRSVRLAPARPRSLAARLTAWYAGSAFLLLLVATSVLYHGLSVSVNYEDNNNLTQQIAVLRDLLRQNPDNLDAIRQQVVIEAAAKSYAPILTRLLDGKGRTVMETPGMSRVLPVPVFPNPKPGTRGWDACTQVTADNGVVFRVLSQDVEGAAPSMLDVRRIQVALDHSAEEGLFTRYRHRFWIVLATGLIGSTFIGYVIARRGIRPITYVADTVGRITSANLHERISATGFPSELTVLATTINGMLNRLEDAFARLARFSGDIAHELRTPINVLRGEAEVALTKDRPPSQYREVLGSSLEEFTRLTRLIDRLLFLARAESPATQIRRERVNVGAELAALREFYDVAAGEAGVELQLGPLEPPEGPVAHLDRTLFQRAVGNLVENALAHTPAGGRVRVGARRDDGKLSVEVADTGRGIPAQDLPYVFDRFHRVDESRSKNTGGAGLGLAIVKSIATLHGGSIEIQSELGAGTRITLLFPQEPVGIPKVEEGRG